MNIENSRIGSFRKEIRKIGKNNVNAMHERYWSLTPYATEKLEERHQDSRIGYYDCPRLAKCPDHEVEQQLRDQIHETFPLCRIDYVRQVNHSQMYGMYLLRMEEMKLNRKKNPRIRVRERVLYHVTTEKNGMRSLENGLDWRLTTRSRYGRGVSFSNDADYADFYANNSQAQTGEERGWFNLGNDIVVPPETIDTTVNTEKLVYVKFNDYEFYPLYMVYYRRTPEDLRQSRYFNRNKQKPRICAPSARKPDAQRSEQQPERQRPLTQQLRQYHDAENRSRQEREKSSQTERKFMLQQQRERKYEQERQKRKQNRGNCLIL